MEVRDNHEGHEGSQRKTDYSIGAAYRRRGKASFGLMREGGLELLTGRLYLDWSTVMPPAWLCAAFSAFAFLTRNVSSTQWSAVFRSSARTEASSHSTSAFSRYIRFIYAMASS